MTTEFVGPVTLPSGATTQGRIRVSAANPLPVTAAGSTFSATADALANTVAPTFAEGSTNPLSSNLGGWLRTLSQIDQSNPGTTNAIDATNFPFAVDVNSGAKSNSTLRVVLATDQPALSNAQPENISQVAGNAVAATGANVPAGTLPVQDADGLRVASASVTSATTVIGPFDTTGFASGSIDITSIGTGCTIILEGSNDNTNFFQQLAQPPGSLTASQFSTFTMGNVTGLYTFNCTAKYYRVRVSVYGSGTVTAGAVLRKASQPNAPSTVLVGSKVGSTVVDTVATNGNFSISGQTSLTMQPVRAADALASLVTLSAAAASTINSVDQVNIIGSRLNLGINLTTMTAASVVVHVQGKDAVSGQYYDILVSGALTGTGFTRLTIGSGLTAVANSVANDQMPRTWRVQVVINNNSGTAAVTGTIGGSLAA